MSQLLKGAFGKPTASISLRISIANSNAETSCFLLNWVSVDPPDWVQLTHHGAVATGMNRLTQFAPTKGGHFTHKGYFFFYYFSLFTKAYNKLSSLNQKAFLKSNIHSLSIYSGDILMWVSNSFRRVLTWIFFSIFIENLCCGGISEIFQKYRDFGLAMFPEQPSVLSGDMLEPIPTEVKDSDKGKLILQIKAYLASIAYMQSNPKKKQKVCDTISLVKEKLLLIEILDISETQKLAGKNLFEEMESFSSDFGCK